ncbi:MAG: carbamoyl-phosphate synthase large subunit [Patescibacteria group bacterium]|nr:carbamoyl-phosphate synthase large subunit [Patescibacteria group bacterium]
MKNKEKKREKFRIFLLFDSLIFAIIGIMKKVKKVLIIGSGPIIIGQAAEFDYSGSQACKALKEEGVFTVLVNSNPATIQTDPTMADKVYLEPLNLMTLTKIIERERPDGILGTMGGQIGLNLTAELAKHGILEKFNVKVLGTNEKAIEAGENREAFKNLMKEIGQPLPKSKTVNNLEEAVFWAKEIGYPVIIRPAYTLGGTGSGIAYSEKTLKRIVQKGLNLSLIHQVLIEECVLGWAEIEYELVRDSKDNVIIVCPMENVDPMGIHTGDSIVAAPLITLTKEEDEMLREASKKIIRALDVRGGCNIQFALNRENKQYRIIEVNPRLSRSSALASKATAYPIARVAAKIALGKSLDQIEIGPGRNAFFEPKPDYVVVKIPRWAFDKIPEANRIIGTQMKSTGEVMAIGKNFEEALLKAIRSLEIRNADLFDEEVEKLSDIELRDLLKNPTDKRVFVIASALRRGWEVEEVSELTKINQVFIKKIKGIVDLEEALKEDEALPEEAVKFGLSLKRISHLTGQSIEDLKNIIKPVYKKVAFYAPYFYSTYNETKTSLTEAPSKHQTNKRKIIVLGSGPIRIGQGIEFDYCCCHAVSALREKGIEAIMVNNNPETVSTDYDTSNRLYFEPLYLEEIKNIIEYEKPDGIILQFGGQTPINLASDLKNKVKILGSSEESIAITEDRDKFSKFLNELGIKQAKFGIAKTKEDAQRIAQSLGYPVLVRPSYVLGGRAMRIVENKEDLNYYMAEAIKVSEEHPILIDHFLENALECEVDALCDGKEVYIPAVMEHIEKAGIHSGDSSCVTPPVILRDDTINEIKEITRKIALSLKIIGLINIQFAVQKGEVYVLEANPRASRTIPYLSKATGIPLAKIATRIILGYSLRDLNLPSRPLKNFAVKSVIFPFIKLPQANLDLSPEMKSTGEVIGIAPEFPLAYFKALQAAGLSEVNNIFISLRDKDKPELTKITQELRELCQAYGVRLFATLGTAKYLEKFGIWPNLVKKLSEEGLDAVDLLREKKIDLVINTFTGKKEHGDSFQIRRAAIDSNVYCITTIEATIALIKALLHHYKRGTQIYSL